MVTNINLWLRKDCGHALKKMLTASWKQPPPYVDFVQHLTSSMALIIFTTAGRGLCPLIVNTCRFGALSEATDAVVLLGGTVSAC